MCEGRVLGHELEDRAVRAARLVEVRRGVQRHHLPCALSLPLLPLPLLLLLALSLLLLAWSWRKA